MKIKIKHIPFVLLITSLLYMMFSTLCYVFELESQIFHYEAAIMIPMIWILLLPILLVNHRTLHVFILTKPVILFVVYIIIFAVINISNSDEHIITVLSESITWGVVFYCSYFLFKQDIRLERVGNLACLSIILCAYCYWINVNLIDEASELLAMGVNSIFYVLCLIPYILFVKNQFLRRLALLVSFIIIVYSSKATAFISIICILLYLYLEQREKKRVMSTVFLTLAIIFLYVICQPQLEQFDVISKIQNIDNTGASGRFLIFISVFKEYASGNLTQLVFGRGYNACAKIIEQSAHNDFLEVLFDYGVIGIVLYITIIYMLIKRYRRLRKDNDICARPLACSLIIFVVCALSSNMIFVPRYFLFIAVIWGISFSKISSSNNNDLII